ncbi:MAG TPA: ATP-binding protein [Candidatus Limnocylindria bacterium]|nr:ATP-binding protein [Candidatus Limnocylindria bacterium]
MGVRAERGGTTARRAAEVRLEAAYEASCNASIGRRLAVTVLAVAAVFGVGIVLEGLRHPERSSFLLGLYLVELAVSGAAGACAWIGRLRARWAACAFGVAVSLLLALHDVVVDGSLLGAAIAQVGLAVSLYVLLLWGWREQACMSAAALASACLVAAFSSDVREAERVFLIVGAVGAATVAGAHLFDRQRHRAFAQLLLLEETSAEKEALLDAALDAILTIDDAGRVTEANAAAVAAFGYDRRALVGRPFNTLVEGAVATPETRIDDHMRLDATAHREDGSSFPVEVTIAPVRRRGSRAFVSTIRDISERKQTERALVESKRLAEEEAEIASALLYAGETLSAHLNQPYMVDRLTCRAVEAVGCDWGATFVWDETGSRFVLGGSFGIPPEVHAEIDHMDVGGELAAAVRGPWTGALVELNDRRASTLISPAVLERWGVTAALCAPIARRGEVIGALCLGWRGRSGPFTERQRRLALGIAQAAATALENARLIADLKAANRLKTEFVSTMSHELRTPLHVMLGFSEMASDLDLEPEQRREYLARVQEAGRELLSMIESTLEIGRLETGRDEVRRDEIALPALLDELHGACAVMPRAPEVTLLWCERVPPVRLVSDQRKLTIILRNLVGNALKFTKRGHVGLSVRVRPDAIQFVVTDTGIGIRPEDREAIFEMFRQADQSDSRRYGGTGLGLYIARRYVEQLGGTLDLESTPGLGSTFTVTVPRGTERDMRERAA